MTRRQLCFVELNLTLIVNSVFHSLALNESTHQYTQQTIDPDLNNEQAHICLSERVFERPEEEVISLDRNKRKQVYLTM